MREFIDANLWGCRLDRCEPKKPAWVGDWLRAVAQTRHIVVSTQVLIELHAVLGHNPALPPADATRVALGAVRAFEVVATDRNLALDAHELAQAGQLSWFDALIVEAAIRSHFELYGEDFSHGRRFGRLTVSNPFSAGPDSQS